MAASLVLALITIAGLGILALCLIFFGGSKKNKQAKYKKEKPVDPKVEEKPKAKQQSTAGRTNKQPKKTIVDADLPAEQEVVPVIAAKTKNTELDPAISSLGFSALDDLLIEPKTKTLNKPAEKPADIIAPAAFNNNPPKKKVIEQDILVLHVMASPAQPFVGYELLQAMTTAGLRFGKMDIFHRLDDDNPEVTLFSLCSAVEPGIFDIANIGAIVTPGLSLFMQISAVDNPKTVFNLMLETAEQLAQDLAGHVCDEKRQLLTDEKLHEYLSLTMARTEYV